jgi:hypothetical protein
VKLQRSSCAQTFCLGFVDVKINCTGVDPAELCSSPTVNYLNAVTPACDIASSHDPVLPFTPIHRSARSKVKSDLNQYVSSEDGVYFFVRCVD